MGEPVVIEYEETAADARACLEFALEQRWWRRQLEKWIRKQRRNGALWLATFALGVMGVGGVLFVGERFSVGSPHVTGLLLGVFLGVMLWGRGLSREHLERRWRTWSLQKYREQEASMPRRVRVAIASEGVEMEWPGYQVRVAWKYVWTVGEHQDRACIVAGSTGVAIPARAFPEGWSARTFVERARELMRAAGETEEQRLAKYLAESDAVCPKCRYALRGVTTTKCPECGRELDRSELEEIAARAARERAGRAARVEEP